MWFFGLYTNLQWYFKSIPSNCGIMNESLAMGLNYIVMSLEVIKMQVFNPIPTLSIPIFYTKKSHNTIFYNSQQCKKAQLNPTVRGAIGQGCFSVHIP